MTSSTPTPPVSIIGIGTRVPGADGVPELWRLLVEGRAATGAAPPDRDGAGPGSYLYGTTEFDNDWFAISDREAALMDPQQRLALEVAVEAIDDAGIGYRLRGSNTAVLFGACGFDHGAVVLGTGGHDAPYAVTGSALSIIANRLSYTLDLRGPSLVLDSACSSSLAAIDLALRLLADETVPFAVVGGVNLALLPHTSHYLAEAGFLAPDGRCKPFDAAADGYVRGDGATVLVLQRTADARRQGNRGYAEILGAAVGSDGRSNGLPAPSGRAQQQVIAAAWARAGVDIRSAGYFECHGTGTPVGDAVEIEALATVLGDPGGAVKPYIGSIKSNIGHLEAAAGITGVAKAALCLRNRIIVPTANFRRENPLLRLSERGLRVPTEPIEWTAEPGVARYAGVSSFGFGGTNAHVVLRDATVPAAPAEIRTPVLIGWTCRDEAELRTTARRWSTSVTGDVSLRAPAAAGRALPQRFRAAVLAEDAASAADAFRDIASGSDTSPAILGLGEPRRGRVLFLFSGQGGQHARMGRELAARYPEFARAVAAASEAVVEAGGPRVWTPRHGFADALATTETVQPALFVYQVALARLLAAWGIEPDGVAGHSLGEVAAAVVAGAVSLGDAAHLITVRSRILGRLAGGGTMAMLEATPEQVRRLVEPLRAEVAVAAVNGPRAVVVSGSTRYMETLLRRARRRHYYVRPIPVDFAAHSPQVRSSVTEFRAAVRPFPVHTPQVPLFSTSRVGTVVDSAAMDIDYWADNLCGTVELDAAIAAAADRGYTEIVEVSPHPVLVPAVRDHPELSDSVFAAAHRDGEVAALLRTVGTLYTRGRAVDWSMQGPTEDPVERRVWRRKVYPLLTRTAPAAGTEPLGDHVIAGVPTVPAAYWLRRFVDATPGSIRLSDFVIHQRTDLADLPAVDYRIGADLRALLGPVVLAEARADAPAAPADIVRWMRLVEDHRARSAATVTLDVDEFYAGLRNRGLDYGPRFRPLVGLRAGNQSATGTFGPLPLSAAALDGCLQLIGAAARDRLPADGAGLPVGIASVWVSDAQRVVLTEAHAFLREHTAAELLCDVVALDQHDAPAVALLGVRIRITGTEPGAAQSNSEQRAGFGSFAPYHSDRPAPPGQAVDRRTAGYDATVPTAPEWAAEVLREEHWVPLSVDPPAGDVGPEDFAPPPDPTGPRRHTAGDHPVAVSRALVVGESALATALVRVLDRRVPAQRVAREPEFAAALTGSALTGPPGTAVVLVWPATSHAADIPPGAVDEPARATTGTERAVHLLQQVVAAKATTAVSVVLPDPASVTQQAIAALVRTLQLESGRPVGLIWSDGHAAEHIGELALRPDGPDEVRAEDGRLLVRRFRRITGERTRIPIVADGTYVVTGGLGEVGATAVRWLLDRGAHDVVVLTRRPRPLPPLLEGAEDRVVVVRCDVGDRDDLANALDDIRACGSTIRGLIHAAGELRDAEFDSVTAESVALHFAKVSAAAALIDLTAADPIDFTLLCSSATGVFGAPGQAAYAAANAALDAIARTCTGRRVTSIAWGSWAGGLTRTAGGAAHLRAAGVTPFDVARGTAVLSAVLGHPQPVVLALDHTPTDDPSPVARRLRVELNHGAPPDSSTLAPLPSRMSTPDFDGNAGAEIRRIVRASVAATLARPVDSIDPDADFAALDLSSLLAIELRRRLERCLGIRIATSELFEYPSVAALSSALAARWPQPDGPRR
ncbi:type I polyketide synthase [Nocardia veterana]|uniref:Type I polyketide synthase n=1 Tax=Nocardia veterana TaxID=132249 RepID=A0A7X6LXG9_9NOCA|nr:type I polyketide synthase [Nocardia veterana]NKY85829.1 type I polyketide synthase [Nocardia veterana]